MSKASNTPVVDALKQVLADTYALQIKTQNYHWNVEGPQFRSLHLMFEDQYKELFAAVDEVAERIRALGEPAPGSFKAFSELTKVSPPKDGIEGSAMVKDLLKSHELLSEQAKAALAVGEKAGDDSTVDLLTDRITYHDKTAWMLRSTAA
ncbi:Dps family protein [Inquilinus sp. YAF38]|uniref:Dps family protein n=1 Tax=Inquilinus sp. YAF38 TaxID=3233084 RepID=UPI003F903BC6